MTTYRRRQTDTIEATRFTSDMGGIVRGVTRGDVLDGLEYSEHAGYTFHGVRIAFGDYFERAWELDVKADAFERIAAEIAEEAKHPHPHSDKDAFESIKSVVEEVTKPAPKTRRARTEPSE